MIRNIKNPDEFLTTNELYQLTKLKPRFWEARRLSGDTPPYMKISQKCIRYRWGDVQEWLKKKLYSDHPDNKKK